MRFDDFVKALIDSGWRDAGDAQHTKIRELWEKMFPVIAELEKDLFAAEFIIEDLR